MPTGICLVGKETTLPLQIIIPHPDHFWGRSTRHHPQVLPAPDMEPKKRRGGKRFRKMKERYAMTDVRKAANRVTFNQPEEEVLDGDEVRPEVHILPVQVPQACYGSKCILVHQLLVSAHWWRSECMAGLRACSPLSPCLPAVPERVKTSVRTRPSAVDSIQHLTSATLPG